MLSTQPLENLPEQLNEEAERDQICTESTAGFDQEQQAQSTLKSDERERQIFFKNLLLDRIHYKLETNFALNHNPNEDIVLQPLKNFLQTFSLSDVNQSFYELIGQYNGYRSDRYGQILLNITYLYYLMDVEKNIIQNRLDYFIQAISTNLQNQPTQDKMRILNLFDLEIEYKLAEEINRSVFLEKIFNTITDSILPETKLETILSLLNLDMGLYKKEISPLHFSDPIFLLELANIIAIKYFDQDTQLINEKKRLQHEQKERESIDSAKKENIIHKLTEVGLSLEDEALITAILRNQTAYYFIQKYIDNEFLNYLSSEERLDKIIAISKLHRADLLTALQICPLTNINSVFTKLSFSSFDEYYEAGSGLPDLYHFTFFKAHLNLISTYEQVENILSILNDHVRVKFVQLLPNLFHKSAHLFYILSSLTKKDFSLLYNQFPRPNNISDLIDDLKEMEKIYQITTYLKYFDKKELAKIIPTVTDLEKLIVAFTASPQLNTFFEYLMKIFIEPHQGICNILKLLPQDLVLQLFLTDSTKILVNSIKTSNEFQQFFSLFFIPLHDRVIADFSKEKLQHLFYDYSQIKSLPINLKSLVTNRLNIKFITSIITKADDVLDCLSTISDKRKLLKELGLTRLRDYFYEEAKIKKLRALIPDLNELNDQAKFKSSESTMQLQIIPRPFSLWNNININNNNDSIAQSNDRANIRHSRYS